MYKTIDKRLWGILVLIFALLLISGCSSKDSGSDGEKGKGGDNGNVKDELFVIDPSISGEITFWAWGDAGLIYDDVIEAFNKDFPNITVKLVDGLPSGEMHDKLQTTLAAGSGAPDVSQVEQSFFARYSSGDMLADLLQPPFDAGRYEGMVSDYNWERFKSIDGKRLVGMPWDVTPGVFYYREDIYEEMGLPSDPEELGEFLQSKENVLDAARILAANGKYMYEWRDSPAVHYGDAVGYFDSNFNWTRNDEKMAELLDFVKQGSQLDWAAQTSVLFSDEGKQMVKQGVVASFPAATWAARDLERSFPEQAGKWRATYMPLGLSVGLGGSAFVIPEQSQNKEAAWAWVQWITQTETAWKLFLDDSIQPAWYHITSLPWYQELTNEFLGGQQDYKLYSSIDEQIPVRRLTTLDGPAWGIYIDNVNESIDKNIDSKTTLNKIEDTAMRQLGDDIKKLKEELGIE
ncbi:ABC transporter substrate-binding protein [Lederbergia graminis]|uniref:ABC transporter substrate-binding protein n=1 Tax=Lederbergia graminis TaxID=735518 RepID=A0ABW0LIJ4_9BACI